MKSGTSIFFALSVLLSGCATIDGADDTLPASGRSPAAPSGTASGDTRDAAVFLSLYKASYGDHDSSDKSKAMLESGLHLVYGNCDAYFASAGNTQKWIFVGHDVVGLVGTSATGVMGALGATSSAIAWVGLATTNVYSGIDIFTKHFLFGKDNIASVKTAVLRQLDVDRTTLLKDAAHYDYYSARKSLLDEQDVCTDARIVSLVHATLVTPTTAKTQASGPATANVAAAVAHVPQQSTPATAPDAAPQPLAPPAPAPQPDTAAHP